MSALADIAIFIRVVELGSFTAAANELEISKAAVSKYITRLEVSLGARLLQRTTRRLVLTEAGDAFYRRSFAALQEIDEASREVAKLSDAPRGLLRVSAPVFLGTARVAPLVVRVEEGLTALPPHRPVLAQFDAYGSSMHRFAH